MEKQVKMTIEQAKDLFKSNPEFRNTLLSVFTDEELGIDSFPKTFEDLKVINGYWINEASEILSTSLHDSCVRNANIFPTEKHAKSALAFAQLSQLAARVNGDWIPDWTVYESKYVIYPSRNNLEISYQTFSKTLIVFKTKGLAEKSLQHHRQLWLDYYMID